VTVETFKHLHRRAHIPRERDVRVELDAGSSDEGIEASLERVDRFAVFVAEDRFTHCWLRFEFVAAKFPDALEVVFHGKGASYDRSCASLATHLKNDVLLAVVADKSVDV